MIELIVILLSSLFLIWSFSSLSLNQSSPFLIFASFLSAMLSSVCLVRFAVRALEFLYFAAERDKALICSKRARLHREWSRPYQSSFNYSVGFAPVGKMRPASVCGLPKTVLF